MFCLPVEPGLGGVLFISSPGSPRASPGSIFVLGVFDFNGFVSYGF
jgi:hypothetical protein